MEALTEPCNVSRDLFSDPQVGLKLLSRLARNRGESAFIQRHGTTFTLADAVAVAAAAAAATAFAATVSPLLSLCRLQDPPAPIVPAALGSQARRSKSSRNAKVLAELRRWGTGGTRSGRGQRGKPGEPGQSVRGRSPGGQLRVREFGFSLLDPPLVAGLPHGVGAPAGAPGDEPGLEVAGEYGPGPGGSASGEGAALARRLRLLLSPWSREN